MIRMFGRNVKVERALLTRAERYARIAGYASVDEFVAHAIENELSKLEDADSEDEVRRRLRGLGYIS
jgi:hypothetical protein